MPDFSPVLPSTTSAPPSPPHSLSAKTITTSPNPLLPLYNLAANIPIPTKFKKAKPSLRLQRVKSKDEAVSHDVTKLQTSFAILPSLKQLQTRKWTLWDLQHMVTFGCLAFCLLITPSAPFLKSAAMGLLAVLLAMPATRQFFLPSLPIWVYLFYFFASRFIAPEYRPHIWVKVLPALENILYGANLSNILSAHTYTILDIIAWIPYGLGHFALPLVTTVMLFLFAAPGTTPVWARAFGYMSILGVTIQILFPCTPPWYEGLHGLEPAHYGMEGSPAGLKRIDELFGVDMYTTSFTTAPVPFGAFPSLHGGDAVLEMLFLQYCFPRFRAFFVGYVVWIAWSTMYLNHHYAIDLVGGGVIAAVTYYIARTKWLPRPQLDKTTRWEYEYVEFGDRPRVALDEEYGGMGLGLLQRRGSDEWTLGSSSSFDSMSRGDTLCGSSSSSPNILSPTTPNDDHHGGDLWSKVRTTSPRAVGLTGVVVEEEQREVYVR
ncbi:Phosphatidylinositol:ceramide phosphoinositol transferase (IPC synthase) [Podospora bellae-mahoneyi]|uniref:Phosphatidylinositol:ceramide phosphoinositol transferase (IPC synthase) n=1 Tax=Podospora bellae-mahoneyi TaxID=2093777 RepID=A0ABR0FI78_9PEZI|nr:Phosphatidylinositol:ceramide phosphoinositol transferase (IPC synthase) [Podospora bellae-mahoneyi]